MNKIIDLSFVLDKKIERLESELKHLNIEYDYLIGKLKEIEDIIEVKTIYSNKLYFERTDLLNKMSDKEFSVYYSKKLK